MAEVVMVCNKVSRLLSQYFDGVLDTDTSVRISQHLKECPGCRKELHVISDLHNRLNSMAKIQAPDYLCHLVQMRLEKENKDTWRSRLMDAVSLRWSRIRTTGFQFYWTKALGTVMTAFCLYMISSAIDPFYVEYPQSISDTTIFSQEYREQRILTISKNWGRFPIEQYMRNDQVRAAINPGYLDQIGSKQTDSDSFSVLTMVDRSGAAKIENVIEYPQDRDLLHSFTDIIESARCRPGSMNGRTVPAPLFLIFDQVSVHE
jgi:hypothetical protein